MNASGSVGSGFSFRRWWLQPDIRRRRTIPADPRERVAENGQVGPPVAVEVADEQPRLVVPGRPGQLPTQGSHTSGRVQQTAPVVTSSQPPLERPTIAVTALLQLSDWYAARGSRGDKPAIELFVAGVRGWETGLRRIESTMLPCR
jgi:hypothetical protein